jgi:hypothetical protein
MKRAPVLAQVDKSPSIPQDLVESAMGNYKEKVGQVDVSYEESVEELPRISWADIKAKIVLAGGSEAVAGGSSQIADETTAEPTGKWFATNVLSAEGTRGVAEITHGQGSKAKTALFPFVVLPTEVGKIPLIAILDTRLDVRDPDGAEAKKFINRTQQDLLDTALSHGMPGTGTESSHASDGRVNAAEVGHAALTAVALNSNGIHAAAHAFGESKKTSRVVMQQMTIYTEGQPPRETGANIYPIQLVDKLHIRELDQVAPGQKDRKLSDSGVGLVLAVQDMKLAAKVPIADVNANLISMGAS